MSNEEKTADAWNWGGSDLTPKKKHRIVLEKGEWVMNKKTIQDRINEKYNGR